MAQLHKLSYTHADLTPRDYELLKFIWDSRDLPLSELHALFHITIEFNGHKRKYAFYVVQGRDLVCVSQLIAKITGLKHITDYVWIDKVQSSYPIHVTLAKFFSATIPLLVEKNLATWQSDGEESDLEQIVDFSAVRHFKVL